MKICCLIKDDAWRKTAGVRIRYDRLMPHLKRQGHALELVAIDAVDPRTPPEADIYLFSKIHDMRSVMLATRLHERGARVGIDVVDDYYSHEGDARFTHLRRWFAMMTPLVDFALCSCPNMAQLLERLIPSTACHILYDPFAALDADHITRTVAVNAARARADKVLRIGWFGIGDNPHFDLGLSDVFAFAHGLSAVRRLGYSPVLEILTNARALTTERLEMLARLPLPWTLEEWSEAGEAELIARSLVCFLPVNAQGFSTVKSLNRCITALTGGAQALSVGFPLYEALSDFVYRDIAALVADLEADKLKLRGETTGQLVQAMVQRGTPRIEAGRLVEFLAERVVAPPAPAPAPGTEPVNAVIHAQNSHSNIHKMAQRMGWLSVAGPYYRKTLHYDVWFPEVPRPGQPVEIRLSPRAWALMGADEAAHAQEAERGANDEPVYALRIAPQRLTALALMPPPPPGTPPPLLSQVARFAGGVAFCHAVLELLFEAPRIHISELCPPFRGPDCLEPPNPARDMASTEGMQDADAARGA